MFHFSVFVIVLQLLFILLFGVFVRYSELGVPLTDSGNVSLGDSHQHGRQAVMEVGLSYPCASSVISTHLSTANNYRCRTRGPSSG